MSKNKEYEKIEKNDIGAEDNIQENINTEENKLSWKIDEFVKHQRNKKWYMIASAIALALIIWAIIDKNYFFALIIILSSALIVFYDGEVPNKIDVKLEYNGLFVGNNFYEFQSISSFYIIYKPEQKVKKIFFEFKNPLKNRLSISLENENPIIIRDYLLQYLKEDLEKENEPLSEGLSKLLKL